MATNALLPMPDRLEPKSTARTLMHSVKHYFYVSFNSPSDEFRDYLASVSNKDALTGNRFFDRHVAVEMLVKAAKAAGDPCFENVTHGKIFQMISRIMADHPEIALKHRREEYRRLTQSRQAAA